ncbi:nucleotidyl transferase AbiEii/AbiGii toxin family protein [Candidatus Roizmanbacteria bacterium]|nr:nucleotidyl transferase AbiEii/AbiGii toxin family protein [Candidatus Roizmanbacteria bacterium]
MLTRQQLEIINRRTLRYPLHVAEKDYFLALVLQKIARSQLGNTLIFKGGTALHHCYLDQHRFSEDLDFSSHKSTLTIEQVRNIFIGTESLTIKKDFLSKATIKIEKLQYIGPLVQPNSLKVEIDYFQNVLLPPQLMIYHNVWGVDIEILTMDIKEICAEKIRAMSERARYRDYYDSYLLMEKYNPNLDEIVSYIKRKEIRAPITKTNIKTNWQVVLTEKENEMNQIYYSRQVEDKQIEKLIDGLPFESIS